MEPLTLDDYCTMVVNTAVLYGLDAAVGMIAALKSIRPHLTWEEVAKPILSTIAKRKQIHPDELIRITHTVGEIFFVK